MLSSLHGLPAEVIYCKKCAVNNQRPATHPEFSKKAGASIRLSAFGDDGICDACKFAEFKKTIDWDQRRSELDELCDRHRRDDGRWDVIVPGSGGKDSIFVSHVLKYECGMNPLIVTWAPHAYTEIGWHNLAAWQRVGHDHILVTPNPKVHAQLTRLAFENLLNPLHPFIIGMKILAPRFALQMGIPLVMYGENNAEGKNKLEEAMSPIMDPAHYTCESREQPLFFSGVSTGQLAEMGIHARDLQLYQPLLREDAKRAGIEVHFMSNYRHWSPQQNFYHAKEVSDFETNPDGASEGTYSKHSSLDDKIDGQHYFTMLIKFGQGRAMCDAVRDVRDGYITREEAVQLMNRYDADFPTTHFAFFLNYIGIDEDRYWEIIDRNRSSHLWKKSDNQWVLRHPCV